MASYIRQKPARWFGTAAMMLFLWAVLGCVALYFHATFDPAASSGISDWDRDYYRDLPLWFVYDYAIAVGASLLGSIAMLRRSRSANILYIISFAAVVVQFGYVFIFTGIVASKGVVQTLPFPLIILGIAILQIWLAGLATRRGWIL
ncbi:hypothetical protein ACX40Y_09900 [Sphingomonas sp. RS6]